MNTKRLYPALSSLFVAIGLSGCLGDDTASKLSGTAATGAPIVDGNVTVTCAGGSDLSTTTSNAGYWEVPLSGQTLPCAVEVTDGFVEGVANTTPYHSIAMSVGTVNITPLTELVVANFAGQSPSTWFNSLNHDALKNIKSSDITSAVNTVKEALNLDETLVNLDPLFSSFKAEVGNQMDNVLEALKTATADYSNFQTLLNEAAKGLNFTAPNGFDFSTAWDQVNSGNAGNGDSGDEGDSGNLPAGLSSQVMDLVYQNAQANSPYSNGATLKFTFSESGQLMLGEDSRSIGLHTLTGVEYIWTDTAHNLKYAVSLKQDGTLNEINVNSTSGTFYGQFAAASSDTGGSGDTGGTGTGNTGTLTVSVTANGIAAPAVTVNNVPRPTGNEDFCGSVQDDTTFTNIGTMAGGTLTINNCTYANNVGTISATLNLTQPIAMTLPYSVVYTYN